MASEFSKEAYDENDARGKKAIRDFLDSKGIPTVVHEDYGPDIKALLEAFCEVEIKRGWEGEWPQNWGKVRIPARKKRLFKDGKRIIFFVLNNDCTKAFRVFSSDIKDEYLENIPNSWSPEGEMFYNIPKDVGVFMDITIDSPN